MPGFLDRFRRSDVDSGDRELIRLMLDEGEQLGTRPRETTHYLHFESARAADEAVTQARAAGFMVEVGGPDEGRDDWQVRASHTIIVNESTITTARRRLTGVALDAGGLYDGWDTYSDEALDEMHSG
jgi:Regulator of ribonuclease activity B